MISRRVWIANSDGTLTPELMAMNPESYCRTSKVATISHGPSVRHSHALMHGGHQGRERIPRNFGPPTDDEPFRYEFTAPLGFCPQHWLLCTGTGGGTHHGHCKGSSSTGTSRTRTKALRAKSTHLLYRYRSKLSWTVHRACT